MSAAFTPNTLRPRRASRNFQVLQGGVVNPFMSMRASTSGVAGQLLRYHTVEGQVDVVVTAQTIYQETAGWLVQDVRDLSALNGYRVPNSTIANFGDPVAVVNGPFLAVTRTYATAVTSLVAGDYLENDANAYLVETALTGSGLRNALTSGVILARVDRVSTNDLNPSIEPVQPGQTTPSNRDFIAVRVVY